MIASFILNHVSNKRIGFILLVLFLVLSTVTGICVELFLFHAFKLNYILIGMAFSATLVNGIPEEKANYIGGKITKAPPTVTKYLGFTLLPHSGVSLVFTGIAAIIAKYAFIWAGEIQTE